MSVSIKTVYISTYLLHYKNPIKFYTNVAVRSHLELAFNYSLGEKQDPKSPHYIL